MGGDVQDFGIVFIMLEMLALEHEAINHTTVLNTLQHVHSQIFQCRTTGYFNLSCQTTP